MLIRNLAIWILVCLGVPSVLAAQGGLRIICSPTRPTASCGKDISNSDKVSLPYWVVDSISVSPVPNAIVYVSGIGGTVGPSVFTSNAAGYFVATWMGSTKVKGSALIAVVATSGVRTGARLDTLSWAPPVVRLSLRANHHTYRWTSGQYIPDSMIVWVEGFKTTGQPLVDDCESQLVVFRRTLNDVKPDTVQARYRPPQKGDPSGCTAAIRWRLADVAGNQEIRAELVGGHTTADGLLHGSAPYADIRAVAAAPARFLVGVADMFRTSRNLPDGTSAKLARPVQPLIGLDFSLPTGRWHTSRIADAFDRLRLVAATSVLDPGADGYAGIEIAPLFEGSEVLNVPMQLTVGWRVLAKGHGGRIFAALTYDASGALTSALKGLGL